MKKRSVMMFLLGSAVNLLTVLVGGLLGTLLHKGISERISKAVLSAVGLCVVYLGLSDLISYATEYSKTEGLSSYHILIPILSLAIGAALGEWIDIEGRMQSLGNWLQKKLTPKNKKEGTEAPSIAQGFVVASVIFCVGAMAILGSLRSGFFNDHQLLVAKSVLDGITGFVLASSLGIGVSLAALPVFLYPGILSTVAFFIGKLIALNAGSAAEVSSMLSSLPAINEMTCVGGLIILSIGLNMVGCTKIRVANLLPALLLPFLFCLFIG